MNFFILVGGSSRTTGDLIKPKKISKKGPKTGQKRAREVAHRLGRSRRPRSKAKSADSVGTTRWN